MPRGPRKYLRPVAESTSQPISSTSTGSWPTDWQASRRYGIPASRATAPISAAGLTRPPFVGTCVIAISLARSSTLLDSRARALPDLVRASVHYYNTGEELERLVEAIGNAAPG